MRRLVFSMLILSLFAAAEAFSWEKVKTSTSTVKERAGGGEFTMWWILCRDGRHSTVTLHQRKDGGREIKTDLSGTLDSLCFVSDPLLKKSAEVKVDPEMTMEKAAALGCRE